VKDAKAKASNHKGRKEHKKIIKKPSFPRTRESRRQRHGKASMLRKVGSAGILPACCAGGMASGAQKKLFKAGRRHEDNIACMK